MRILASVFVSSLLVFSPITSHASLAGKISKEEKQEIIDEVISYFKNNPAEIVEAIIEWRKKSEETVEKSVFPIPTSGNPAGDVTIFEFPDYGCNPCNEISSIIDRISAEDGMIAIVHHDLPRNGGVLAVQAASEIIAANGEGLDWSHLRNTFIKYGIQPETRLKALEELGVNPHTINAISAMPNIRENNEIAKRTGIQTLPSIVIAVNDKAQVLSGKITEKMIKDTISLLRKESKIDGLEQGAPF